MVKRVGTTFALLLVTVVGLALSGCGSSHSTSDQLVQLKSGKRYVYSFTGTVTLPSSLGGGTQNVKSGSTYTTEVSASTVSHVEGSTTSTLNVWERKFNLTLLDTRTVTANLRLYFVQTDFGIFVHGFNNAGGTTIDTAKDVFVPGTVSPAYQFLYLPNPASDSINQSYANPFGTAANGGYTLQIGGPRQPVSVPGGDFQAKPTNLSEGFNNLTFTGAAFVPEFGIASSAIQATLADGTQISGTIVLTSIVNL